MAEEVKPKPRKKYVVSRTEIFVADPDEDSGARKAAVGDVVELTAAEARDFVEKGCLAPYIEAEADTAE